MISLHDFLAILTKFESVVADIKQRRPPARPVTTLSGDQLRRAFAGLGLKVCADSFDFAKPQESEGSRALSLTQVIEVDRQLLNDRLHRRQTVAQELWDEFAKRRLALCQTWLIQLEARSRKTKRVVQAVADLRNQAEKWKGEVSHWPTSSDSDGED